MIGQLPRALWGLCIASFIITIANNDNPQNVCEVTMDTITIPH